MRYWRDIRHEQRSGFVNLEDTAAVQCDGTEQVSDLSDVANPNEGILEIAGAGEMGQAMVGGFQQTTTGEFDVDLTGPVSGNYDQLIAAGHASLAGELNAAISWGYVDPTVPGTVDGFVRGASHDHGYCPLRHN